MGRFKQFVEGMEENINAFRTNLITDEGLIQYSKGELFSIFMQLNAILRSGDLPFEEQSTITQNIQTIKGALNTKNGNNG